MELISADGAFVSLLIAGYQFPERIPEPGEELDGDWLVIQGRVRTSDGRAWSINDPCLTTGEAWWFGEWLRGVPAGEAVHPSATVDDWPEVTFTEPNLGFSVSDRDAHRVQLLVYFSLEAAPPWWDDRIYEFAVELDLATPDLRRAVDDWDAQLARDPDRSEGVDRAFLPGRLSRLIRRLRPSRVPGRWPR